jgi:hypothetical protein
MSMRRFLRAGLVAAALCAASPALASDFSGIGRIMLWGILALGALIIIPIALFARKGRRGSPLGNAFIAITGAVIFAPAVIYRDYDDWTFLPFPGSAAAMLDGRWEVLWPVPLLSIIGCAAGAFWLLQRTGKPADDGEGPA